MFVEQMEFCLKIDPCIITGLEPTLASILKMRVICQPQLRSLTTG